MKRAATLATYLDRTCSPTVKKLQDFNIITSPEESSDTEVEKAVLEDIKVAVNESKMKRTSDTLNGMNTIIASISGENVSEKKCRKRLARKLPIRRISGGKRIRIKVLTSDNSCWSFTKRKTRSDALSDEIKRKVYEYWPKPGVSRPTGNKRDVK